jgi:two-component system OmpR family response regulator
MSHLLVIDDDVAVCRELNSYFGGRGYQVSLSHSGADALQTAMVGSADLLIIDRLLPGIGGLDLLAALRRADVATPAIVLSSLGTVSDRVTGLNAGFDDYLPKPFELIELDARVRALLRRPSYGFRRFLDVGPVQLDLVSRTVRRGGRMLELLPREFQILEFLMRRAGEPVTRGMLFAGIWNYNFQLSPNLVDVHVGKLRRKLSIPGESEMLTSLKGVGFVLNAPKL